MRGGGHAGWPRWLGHFITFGCKLMFIQPWYCLWTTTTSLSRLETALNGWLRCITRDSVGSPGSTSTKDLMAKTNQMPTSTILKERTSLARHHDYPAC